MPMERDLGPSARAFRDGGRGLGGVEVGPASAPSKMFWSEYARRFAELVINIRSADSMVMPDGGSGGVQSEPDRWQRSFLGTRSVTIWGGTAQVQRNIVGERVLGLPKDPAPGGPR